MHECDDMLLQTSFMNHGSLCMLTIIHSFILRASNYLLELDHSLVTT